MIKNNSAKNSESMTSPGSRYILYSGLVATFAALVIAGILFVWETARQTDRDLRHHLLQQARMVAEMVDIKDVLSLSGTGSDLNNPAYLRLKQRFAAVQKAHGRCRFVYLIGRGPDDRIFFYLDNEPPDSATYSPPGQEYNEASAELHRLFSDGREFVEGPASDRWGRWVSALIPLRDPATGTPVAVFGLDIDARDWRRMILSSAVVPMGLTAGLIILLAMSYALAFSRRRALDHQEALRQNREALSRVSAETEKQRQLMESLLDAIPAPVFFKDGNGFYLGCNPAFEKITGLPEADIVGKKPHGIWPEQFSATYLDRDMELLATGGRQQYEYQYPGADGSVRDVIFYKSTFFNTRGEIDGIVGVMLDITERKKAEAELIRLRQAMDQVGDMIVITDAAGIIQYVNPAFEKITGYGQGEAVGQNPRILKSGRQDPAFYQNLWSTITSGKTWQGRMVNKRKDGTLYTEESTISPVLDNAGRIVNFAAVQRDITEHIRLTGQLQYAQKMETVGRLAGGVAHDFNNMLNVIIGHAELILEDSAPGGPFHEDMREILGAARRSAEITRQLLAFARKQTIAPQVLDLNAVVDGMLKMLRRITGEDIDLAWRPYPGLWPVNIDPGQVDQIMVNLMSNAREAVSGTGRIIIETANISAGDIFCANYAGMIPGDYVHLSIYDNGRGMDKVLLDRLFEPFFTTKEVGEGSGLGLATVYGIVKQNNGYIYAESEPLKGTTFRVFLPRHAGRPDQCRATGSAGTTSSDRRSIVLIVEDERSILKLARRILERQGYTILTADSPSEALNLTKAQKAPIKLLITDVIMPEINGRELFERIRSYHPGIKVLYMSGYTADIIGQRGVLTDEVHYIQKPFTNQALVDKVRETLAE